MVALKRFPLRLIAPGLVLVFLLGCASALAGERLTVQSAGGDHHFTVEIADEPEERRRGLMFREYLASDAGMLFQFERPAHVSFWMMNTLIPLDMIFIAADGRIVSIAERTVPQSLDPVPSRAPVTGVLELAGGTVERLGIAVGDRVRHPFFEGERSP